ncbi:CDT1-like protein b [Apostasia shenzhenica]|uniref:CDT1-like protein b n=1 Tax=Apostasia shenzhenica TaxID=1088818 RepID=A0A2I0AKE9_9ASPA|nr:CDT1-like protein b [Apostasia shenzhenica]
MENERMEKQTSIPFRSRKILPGVSNSTHLSAAARNHMNTAVKDDSGNKFGYPTPEKPDWKLSTKEKKLAKDSPIQEVHSEAPVPEITSKFLEIPDKLKGLAELFDKMDTSIRLLGLRKRLSTFQNIRTQVQLLTKREFSYNHLAQMKYAFPDAIQIEKVLIHDEKTLCMKPDLKVNLIMCTECPSYPGQSISMSMSQAFRVRLLDLLSANAANPAKDLEIPEVILPEPFNRGNDYALPDSLSNGSLTLLNHQASDEIDSLPIFSHFTSSFSKQFCQKKFEQEAQKTQILASSALLSAIVNDDGKTSNKYIKTLQKDYLHSPFAAQSPPQASCTPRFNQLLEKTPVKSASTAQESMSELINTPSYCNISCSCEDASSAGVQNASDVVTETPDMQTPRRPMLKSPEILISVDEKSTSLSKSTTSVRRTLLYSPLKVDFSKLNSDSLIEEPKQIYKQACHETMSTKKDSFEQESNLAGSATSTIEEAHSLSQINFRKRQAVLGRLPATFNTIHRIFQSTECSLITKQELVHKIVSNNLDVDDTSDVEEQLRLLEEFAPEWICKDSSNGESIYCIKHIPDLNSVRQRLLAGA